MILATAGLMNGAVAPLRAAVFMSTSAAIYPCERPRWVGRCEALHFWPRRSTMACSARLRPAERLPSTLTLTPFLTSASPFCRLPIGTYATSPIADSQDVRVVGALGHLDTAIAERLGLVSVFLRNSSVDRALKLRYRLRLHDSHPLVNANRREVVGGRLPSASVSCVRLPASRTRWPCSDRRCPVAALEVGQLLEDVGHWKACDATVLHQPLPFGDDRFRRAGAVASLPCATMSGIGGWSVGNQSAGP